MSEKSSESRGIENEKSSANHVELNLAGFASSSRFEAEGEYYAIYPNRWSYYRKHYLREAASEFLGCMVLIIFGTGVDLQVILSNNTRVASSPRGDMLSIHFGWAVGTALGVWTASLSGGHINPAVTLSLAVFRGFPWRKVPIYLLAQLSGACFGGLLTYSNYMHAIAIVDPGKTQATASLFTTYALDYMPNVACFFSEFLGTAVLLIIVLATTDNANGPPPKGLLPLVLFILILGEGISLGMETAYALNPARDLGPRIALAMVGYSKQVLFDYRHQYWVWTPILGPVTGALTGSFVYDALIFTGPDSILNFPNAAAKEHRSKALGQQPREAHGIDMV